MKENTIFKDYGITIVYGNPGKGKSTLLSFIANEYCFDKDRNSKMRKAIREKNDMGFNLTIPTHCVSANYGMNLKKPGYTVRQNRLVNAKRIGYSNEEVKTHFSFPYEVTFVDEAQNDYPKGDLPYWQRGHFEQHRHLNLRYFMATQRPMRINKDIRDISDFIEIREMKIIKKHGEIIGVKWLCRYIESNAEFEQYANTGKSDKKLYKNLLIICTYNPFKIFDSHCFEPEFYRGNLNRDFDILKKEMNDKTWLGYFNYFETVEKQLKKE